MILMLRKTIPSGSHNAPYNEEHGAHWPEGQQFKLLDEEQQMGYNRHCHMHFNSLAVEQIGGEEVIVYVPKAKFPELFGMDAPEGRG